MKSLRYGFGVVALTLLLAACASQPEEEEQLALGYDEIEDPLEPLNRATFEFNLLLDAMLLRPIAEPYSEVTPQFLQDIVRNLVRIADTPRNMINAILQGDLDAMENIAARTLINLTVGVGGIADVATDTGYPYQEEDFGQTLAVWGVGPGTYVVLPVFGPSSTRDSFGRVVDIFFDPMTYYRGVDAVQTASLSKTVAGGIDLRARNLDTLDELKRDSVDFYARIRSLWHQNRMAEIRNGDPSDIEVPDFTDDFLDEDPLMEDAAPGDEKDSATE